MCKLDMCVLFYVCSMQAMLGHRTLWAANGVQNANSVRALRVSVHYRMQSISVAAMAVRRDCRQIILTGNRLAGIPDKDFRLVEGRLLVSAWKMENGSQRSAEVEYPKLCA